MGRTDRPGAALHRYLVVVAFALLGLALLNAPLIREGRGNGELVVTLVILLAAWYGGRDSGLLVTILVAVATYRPDPAIWRVTRHLLGLLNGVAISLVVGALHAALARAEQAAVDSRASNERFRRLWESGLIGVAITDLDGPVREANDEYLRVIGRGRDELGSGQVDWCQVSAPEYREQDSRKIRELVETGVCTPFVKEYVRKGGERVAVLVGAALLEGSRDRCLTLVLDVSARRRAEASLWLLAAAGDVLGASLQVDTMLSDVARLAVPAIGDLCVIHLLDTDGRIRQVAQALADPSLAAAAETISRIDPSGPGRVTPVKLVMQSGRPLIVPVGEVAADPARAGARSSVGLSSVMAVPLAARGRTLGTVMFGSAAPGRRFDGEDLALAEELARRAGVAVDNARLLSEANQARQEAERANHAKDRFLAALSHELRTPLTPVLVGVTALLDDPDVPEGLRPVLEVTRRNVALEARLIDDLLDVTRIAQGKLRLERSVVDAHGLIAQAVEICRDEAAASGVRLDLALAASERFIEGDPARVQQILWNLIKNASKFTPAGGQIVVRSRNDEPTSGDGARPRLVVDVVDSGIGIEPDALGRIFNAFEQADATIITRFGGLGLGLAISRSLAEAHGGHLTASSAGRGHGATFTLDLPTVAAPRSAPAAAPEAPAPQAGQPSGPLHILLAEDNSDTLRVMARLLRRRGHRVAAADGFQAALRTAAAEGPFDLVISDIGLPDGSGLDLMRKLRTETVHPLPGIALSGYGAEDDLHRSRDAGFIVHLTKPVDFPTLESAIHRAVRDVTA